MVEGETKNEYMCGIAGIIYKDKNLQIDELVKLTDSMTHRGPDGNGYYHCNNFGIGHRRLSIIDLRGGKQPMSSEGSKVYISYNGEIYNYSELRALLERDGYIFKTNSDTEVVLNAYLKWGEKCVNHLRGMFAFSVIDKNNDICFLARDPFGVKPLAIYEDEEKIVFASEIQAFKRLNYFDNSINIQAIDQFLTFQYIPAPNSIYKHVKKVLPGNTITISLKGTILRQERYYNFGFEPNEKMDIDDIEAVIKDSISKHLLSDVEYGAFLSGGIDSTLTVAYMTQILEQRIKTFSIGFEDDDYSELEFSNLVSKKNNTNHHVEVIGGNALKVLPYLVEQYGEPFGDSSMIPTYYVSKLASSHVKMVLSGDGADELFAGYRRYEGFLTRPAWTGDEYLRRQGNYDAQKKENCNRWNECYDERFRQIVSIVTYYSNTEREKLWKADYLCDTNRTFDLYYPEYKSVENNGWSKVQLAQYMDIKNYLPYAILKKVDIVSMANSLEVRVPFVDAEVAKIALAVPYRKNIGCLENGGIQGKLQLKKLLETKYGKDFVYREKRGFSMPLNKWLNDPSNLAFEYKNRLLDSEAKILEYFNKDKIKNTIEANNSGQIWLLMILEEWLQQNM